MINKALLKKNLKSEYKITIIFVAILLFYSTVMIVMYDMFTGDEGLMLKQMLEMMPEMAKMFGFTYDDLTLTGYLCSYLYGMILLVFPMIFSIILSYRLVAKHVDKGSMAYLLASPNSRFKIIFTQLIYMLLSIIAVIVFITIFMIIVCSIAFPGQLAIGRFLLINLGLLFLQLSLGGICFFFSTYFNTAKLAISCSAGICIFFFLMQMIGNVGGDAEWFKYLSIFTLFNPNALFNLNGWAIGIMFVPLVFLATLIPIAIVRFVKKDIHV